MINELRAKMAFPHPGRKAAILGVAFVIFWTPVLLFLAIAGEIIEKEPIKADTAVLFWIHAHATPLYDRLFLFITTLGNVEILGPAALLLVAWLLYKKQRFNAFVVFFSVTGATAANTILKVLIHRSRPDLWHSLVQETSFSFPSGHAMISCAFVLSIIAISRHARTRWLIVAAGSMAVALIGVSRLYLGAHYPSDILAGWSASLAWVVIVYTVAHGVAHKRRRALL